MDSVREGPVLRRRRRRDGRRNGNLPNQTCRRTTERVINFTFPGWLLVGLRKGSLEWSRMRQNSRSYGTHPGFPGPLMGTVNSGLEREESSPQLPREGGRAIFLFS